MSEKEKFCPMDPEALPCDKNCGMYDEKLDCCGVVALSRRIEDLTDAVNPKNQTAVYLSGIGEAEMAGPIVTYDPLKFGLVGKMKEETDGGNTSTFEPGDPDDN